nr:MAG TPA_asm: hypothetical protein [Microviridae sp.]
MKQPIRETTQLRKLQTLHARKRGGDVNIYSRFFKPKKRSTHVAYYIKYNIVTLT